MFTPEIGPQARLPLLQLLECLGPVPLEEPRQSAIREELPSGLTGRAVVRLVVGVADPLHGRSANRTGLPVPPVHGHPGAKRGHLLGEPVPDVGAESLDPLP
jgi:hypothetical protein